MFSWHCVVQRWLTDFAREYIPKGVPYVAFVHKLSQKFNTTLRMQKNHQIGETVNKGEPGYIPSSERGARYHEP